MTIGNGLALTANLCSQADITWAWETRIKPHCVRLALRNEHYTHTFSEVCILIALALFDKYEVNWAALEVSVGGRYDQARALDVVASVLTNVGGDHAHMLGHEQWQRVLDKAGIARPRVPFLPATPTRPIWRLSPLSVEIWKHRSIRSTRPRSAN